MVLTRELFFLIPLKILDMPYQPPTYQSVSAIIRGRLRQLVNKIQAINARDISEDEKSAEKEPLIKQGKQLKTLRTNLANAYFNQSSTNILFCLTEDEFGETFYYAATLVLYSNCVLQQRSFTLQLTIPQRSGLTDNQYKAQLKLYNKTRQYLRQRAFLENIFWGEIIGNRKNDFQVTSSVYHLGSFDNNPIQQEFTGDNRPPNRFPAGSVNLKLLCPYFLMNPFQAPFRIYQAFVANLTPDHITGIQDHIKSKLRTALGLAAAITDQKRAVIWLRNKPGEPATKTLSIGRVRQIRQALFDKGIHEVFLLGDVSQAFKKEVLKSMSDFKNANAGFKFINLIGFFNELWFMDLSQENSFAHQVAAIKFLFEELGVVCLIGNKSGGMDAASLAGVTQIFFEMTNDQYSGWCTRLGITALCCPYFHQIAIEDTDQVKDLSDAEAAELGDKIDVCLEVKTWHINQRDDDA